MGAVYDESTHRFDHHQRGFEHVLGHGFNTKLSSAGLVYKHFGKEVLSSILGISQDDPSLDSVYLQTYKQFMESVDAIDNGISQYDTLNPPRYLNNTTLSARVARLNPSWNEDQSDEILDQQFLKAVEMTGSEFKQAVEYVGKVWLPARTHVQKALEGLKATDPSEQIMKLDVVCPWKEHLYQLEEEMKIAKPVLFCIYHDDKENKWRVQAVSVTASAFENRRSMPKAWRGVRDEALSEIAGIKGCVFCHAGGFIGGNDSYEGALEMARKSLTID